MGGAGGAVAAGGSGVMFSGTAGGATVASAGGGAPVGVLTTATPMGVSVAGADGGGVSVEPGPAVAFGSGVRMNCRVTVGCSPDDPPGTLVAAEAGGRVAVALAVAVGERVAVALAVAAGVRGGMSMPALDVAMIVTPTPTGSDFLQ